MVIPGWASSFPFSCFSRSSLTCPHCLKQSNTFDPFLCISLPIPLRHTRWVSDGSSNGSWSEECFFWNRLLFLQYGFRIKQVTTWCWTDPLISATLLILSCFVEVDEKKGNEWVKISKIPGTIVPNFSACTGLSPCMQVPPLCPLSACLHSAGCTLSIDSAGTLSVRAHSPCRRFSPAQTEIHSHWVWTHRWIDTLTHSHTHMHWIVQLQLVSQWKPAEVWNPQRSSRGRLAV